MKQLPKEWQHLSSGTMKFLAANLAHHLSRISDRRRYEVVLEGYIDPHHIDSEQPDIVVYDKDNDLHPVLILEICDAENLEATLRTMEILSTVYKVDEAFVIDFQNEKWYIGGNGIHSWQENPANHPIGGEFEKLLKIKLNKQSASV